MLELRFLPGGSFCFGSHLISNDDSNKEHVTVVVRCLYLGLYGCKQITNKQEINKNRSEVQTGVFTPSPVNTAVTFDGGWFWIASWRFESSPELLGGERSAVGEGQEFQVDGRGFELRGRGFG